MQVRVKVTSKNIFRALRHVQGKNLSDLAEELGRNISSVSRIERGISGVSLEDAVVIAQALKVPVGMIFS